MSACRTEVVGTDGSQSSLRAVVRAGAPAGACGADLLVVGDRGPNGLADRLGSARADAARRSACDVLVVRTTG